MSNNLQMITCHACAFWVADDAQKTKGECRRHAPTPIQHGLSFSDDGQTRRWPKTYRSDCCGDGRINAREELR